MGTDVKRYTVYTTRKGGTGVVWAVAGRATSNRDGSISVNLDSLPLDGRLHLREGEPVFEPANVPPPPPAGPTTNGKG